MKLNNLTLPKLHCNLHIQAMPKLRGWVWRFVLAAICFLYFNQRIRAQDHPVNSHVQAVDGYFSKLEAYGLSGSLLIGTKDQILLKKDYGQQDSHKSVDLAYLVGSLTKQFTATAILLLEQRGLLNTREKISSYLTNIPSDKSEITIHQLLTHTAGLKDDYWDQYRELTEEAYIEMMLAQDILSKPGTRFRYINFGYHLLAKIIETVSKIEYERFLIEELFRPSGLYHTGFKLVEWQENQVALYTDWTTEGNEHLIRNPLDRPIYLQPEGSGGLLSTTGDLYKWYQTIFHSENILSNQSKLKLLAAEKANYAYGWEIYQTIRNTKLIEHGAYDSWVGVVTGIYNFVEEDLVVIFLGNTHMSQFLRKDDLMNDIEALIFGGQVLIPPGLAQYQGQTEVSQHIGVYKSGAKSISILKGKTKNQLRLRTTDKATIQQILFPAQNITEKRTDVQLEYVLNNIKANNYEALRNYFYRDAPFEALKKRYSETWNQLSGMLGQYKGFSVLHTLPNIYEGKFELELITALEFERGIFHLRAFRNHNGRIHLQPLQLPERLEIFLSPINKDNFNYWNVKTGITSTITIQQNKLSINGVTEMFYTKE